MPSDAETWTGPRDDAAPGLSGDFLEIYAQHATFLSRCIARLVGPGPHVEDLLQETFIVAFRKRTTFEGRSSVQTWLYAIARRLCLRHRRSHGRARRFRERLARGTTPPEQAGADSEMQSAEAKALVWEVLGSLSVKHREVFVLYELEELEGTAIAELLGIPVGTVWTRLHHGRKKFETLMRKRVGKERP